MKDFAPVLEYVSSNTLQQYDVDASRRSHIVVGVPCVVRLSGSVRADGGPVDAALRLYRGTAGGVESGIRAFEQPPEHTMKGGVFVRLAEIFKVLGMSARVTRARYDWWLV